MLRLLDRLLNDGSRDQRHVTHYPAGESSDQQLLDRGAIVFGGFRLTDVIWQRHHSEYFQETLSGYALGRLRFMLLFFMAAVPAWSVIDFLTFNRDHAVQLLVVRLLMTLALTGLWYSARSQSGAKNVWAMILLTMAASTAFYCAAILILSSGEAEEPLAGYTAMPFLAITLMGLFPCTIAFGLLVFTIVSIGYLGLAFWMGRLFEAATFNDLWILTMIGGIVIWIEVGQLLMLLKLYRESTRDPLTGLINRRVLMKQLDAELMLHGSSGRTFSLLMLDLDRFKGINDRYGHLVGDMVLRRAAEMMADGLRSSDVVARFGGEEFVVLLPGQSGPEAIPVAERIRKRLEETPVVTPEGVQLRISTSVGVTEYEVGERIEETLSRVDGALYQAKERGRNCTVYGSGGDRFDEVMAGAVGA